LHYGPHTLRESHWTGLRLTAEGRLLFCVAAVLLLVGIFKNINLLALLANVLLALLALGALVVGRRMRQLEGRRVLAENLFAGTRARLEVRVQNPSPGRVAGVRVEDVGAGHAVGWYFDRLEGRARVAPSTEVVLSARGWYDFAPLAAASSHPFGLWQRRVLIGLPLRVLVLPRHGKVVRERLRHYLKSADPRGERVHRHGWRHEAAQADFHGLRQFRPGDSPRWIHWRTSARRGELMVREFEDVPGDDLVLVLDTHAGAAEFESAVSLAATIVVEWCQRRGDRLVLAVPGMRHGLHDGVTGPEHARKLLECLALATHTSVAPCGIDLAADQVPATAAVVVVAADPRSPQREQGEDTTLARAAGLSADLGCPVTLLTPEQLHQQGIYTPP
jgi:uncharacterized protein (DUF58 family)